ncbi:hypothetical protein ElyMa_005397800 [Elysia marginata]|uniref:Uncharacterized protein n=1 Tax=Elysia marginata TaxID=1093978 RepID=A0AAV4EGB7_9GAST|nr:hypothetical protein ElyMa_005397800 [Elysia marginata]
MDRLIDRDGDRLTDRDEDRLAGKEKQLKREEIVVFCDGPGAQQSASAAHSSSGNPGAGTMCKHWEFPVMDAQHLTVSVRAIPGAKCPWPVAQALPSCTPQCQQSPGFPGQ